MNETTRSDIQDVLDFSAGLMAGFRHSYAINC